MGDTKYGHRKLIVWDNIDDLMKMIHNDVLILIPRINYKLHDQIDRASSSIGANLIEGYYSGSTKEFIRFLRYSRRSTAELEFWIGYCHLKGYIGNSHVSEIKDLIIRIGYLIDRLIASLNKKALSS